MKTTLRSLSWLAAIAVAVASLSLPIKAQDYPSGQRANGQYEVEPAFDDSTGGLIYLLTPLKNPFPSLSNPHSKAPLYMVAYPLSSSVPAYELNCQPDNCDHLNVLPFQQPDYGELSGSDPACKDFNGGQPCSPIEGHDHLVGIASTGGDFNQAWEVELVVFTPKAFTDGAINTRVTTLSQLQSLEKTEDVFVVDTGIAFNCSPTSQQTYDLGTSSPIPFP